MRSPQKEEPSGECGCNEPVILIPVQRIRAGGIQQQAIRASGAIVLLDITAPPVLENGLVHNRFRQCRIGVAVSERPANLSTN